ncbi:hypothetical protein [Sinomonas halotolerans]|uniref:Uncharacterized protein n=1 Tax=Sinomonas halotolerans TaxID=1644133 RepID=A0ABU9WXP8_9MICC
MAIALHSLPASIRYTLCLELASAEVVTLRPEEGMRTLTRDRLIGHILYRVGDLISVQHYRACEWIPDEEGAVLAWTREQPVDDWHRDALAALAGSLAATWGLRLTESATTAGVRTIALAAPGGRTHHARLDGDWKARAGALAAALADALTESVALRHTR